jgi:hypothetical protein
MKLIRIGLNEAQKQSEIKEYVKTHDVKSVIVFSPEKFEMALPDLGDVPIRQIEYKEVIMYRTFYPLLEEIGENHLLIVNEFMRTNNRSDLTYNCLRHYLDQCGHQIVFEYFPFINDPSDFMILLDFDTKSKRKGFGFDKEFLKGEDILCQNQHLNLNIDMANLPAGAAKEYEKKKNGLFESIGNRDPDIIPRELHVFTGKWKKDEIRPELHYVARNSRYKLPNVTTYPHVVAGHNYILLDWQHRRLQMNDFLRVTKQTELTYVSTGLSIDDVYINAFNEWLGRLEEFYAEAGIYQ